MAGVKGRSGGSRPNTGGARPGAGRKPKIPKITDVDGSDAEEFLMALVHDKSADVKVRLEAAKALLPYQKEKMAELGKKQLRKDAARHAAGAGRFVAIQPPRLVINNVRDYPLDIRSMVE